MTNKIVVAYTTSHFLLLDADMTNLRVIEEWARRYARFYDLGSVIIYESSKTNDYDRKKRPLNNYFIIFGRRLSWKEIRWHIREAYRFGIVNKQFQEMRKLGNITLRVSAKNSKKPPPKFVRARELLTLVY